MAVVKENFMQVEPSFRCFLLQKFPELKFRYVEEDQPEEFFIPYVWSMVHSTSTLHWKNDATLICLENGTHR